MKRKNNKKKLPRYWLGTMNPQGYQKNLSIRGALSTSTPGSFDAGSEARAAESNILPKFVEKLIYNSQYPLLSEQNRITIPANSTLVGASAINKSGGIANIINRGGTPFVGGPLNEAGLPTEIGVKTGSSSSVASTAGPITSIIGTVHSASNLYNDFAHLNDTLSGSDIVNTAPTNIINSEYGHSYKEHGGIDSNAIRRYEDANKTNKQLGLIADMAGLGLSVGSFLPGLGTVFGGVTLAALGGLGAALGFGDNTDEINRKIKDQSDAFALENMQNKSVWESLNARSAFANRQLAANGKRPVWSPAGLVNKAATARVSNGEIIGNFSNGMVSRVAGEKNNKDTKLANLKDGDFVITNKYGLSDYAAATGDYAGALNLLEMIMGMRNSKGYKNGKLPGFVNGIWSDVFSAIPHFVSFAGNLAQYNRAKNASTYAPDVYIDNPEGTKAVNTLAQLRFDSDPYYKEARRGLNWANYNTRRNVGLGAGGRAITEAMNYSNYLRGLSDITKYANEAQNNYTEKYAAALANLGATNQGRRMEAAAKRHAWLQQAQGQRESWIAQYRKNIDQNLLNAAADYMRMGQYRDALGIQQKMLGLYELNAETDRIKANAYVNSLGNNNSTVDAIKAYDALKNMYNNIIPTRFGNIRIG